MVARSGIVVSVVAVLLFSGCVGGGDDVDVRSAADPSPGGSSGPGGSSSQAAAGGENAPPTVVLGADTVHGQAPLVVTFTVTIGDPEGDDTTYALDADGDGDVDFEGDGDSAGVELEYNFTSPGTFTANLTGSDPTHDVAQSLNITITPPVGGTVPEPIVIHGTMLAGVGGCAVYCAESGENRHPFELNTLVNNLTATITWSVNTVDLDWGIETPGGTLANQERDVDLPAPGDPYAQPLRVGSAELLSEFGTWNILVWPTVAVASDYEITIVFQ